MYGLTIELKRCVDGVELVEMEMPQALESLSVDLRRSAKIEMKATQPPPEMVFRCRTDRHEPCVRTIEDLESPVVVAFVNATDDKKRQLFFGQFGLGTETDKLVWNRGPYRTHKATVGVLSRADTVEHQAQCKELLRIAGGDDRAAAQAAVNSAIGGIGATGLNGLTPVLHLADPRGASRLLLKSDSLLGFMRMEIAMVVANGARSAECEKCNTMFITGPLTGRRSHARFCSDRCRVAAMRARNAANS
jgi:hypothetical protein